MLDESSVFLNHGDLYEGASIYNLLGQEKISFCEPVFENWKVRRSI